MQRLGKTFWLLATLPLLFGFDFASKEWVRSNLIVGEELTLVPGLFSLYHAENPGILFSLPVPVPVVFVLGAIAVVVLARLWWRLPAQARLPSAAIGVIGAGALGNLVDRVPDGHVTDLFKVYTDLPWLVPYLVEWFGTNTWPIFNVADAALLVGVGLWVLHDQRRAKVSASA